MDVNYMPFMRHIRKRCKDDLAYSELASVVECLKETDVKVHEEADTIVCAFFWDWAGEALGIVENYFSNWNSFPESAPRLENYLKGR